MERNSVKRNSVKRKEKTRDDLLRKEREKARTLRQTAWWKRKISSGRCHYCQSIFPPGQLTMDHRIPLMRGGVSQKENLVPACKDCNNRKKNALSLYSATAAD